MALVGLWGCSEEPKEKVLVFAGSSLTPPLESLAAAFEQARPEIDIELIFAGSQTLAMQINAGAHADIFISADLQQMNRIPGVEPEVLAGNQLVAISASLQTPSTIEQAVSQSQRVIAAHYAVPAGRCTRDGLEAIGLWDRTEPLIVSYENSARAVLTKIQSDQADLGFVYRTDALNTAGGVRIIEFPDDHQVNTQIWIAQLTQPVTGASPPSDFYLFLTESGAATDTFTRHGFTVPQE